MALPCHCMVCSHVPMTVGVSRVDVCVCVCVSASNMNWIKRKRLMVSDALNESPHLPVTPLIARAFGQCENLM